MNELHLRQLVIAQDKQMICNNLTTTIRSQEVWGILGPNGSGKTTFLHALANLHRFTSGEIFFNQQNLMHVPSKQRAQILGILLQDTTFTFPQTVLEYCTASRFPHLGYYERLSKQEKKWIETFLALVELTSFNHRAITHLSGGEKRRLAIAALLAQTPQIYLLDEPHNHLDIKFQIKVFDYLYRIAKEQDKMVIMTLHDLQLAKKYCDYVMLFFPQGKVEIGPITFLTPEKIASLYDIPFIDETERHRHN